MIPTSILLVPVAAVDSRIDTWRQRLDPARRQGMPAHVTLVVPFAPPAALDDDLVGDLESLFGARGAFDFVLRRTRWFDGHRVLYLEPEPAEPFRSLTAAVVERYPEYPPYEGAFAEVVPHVTVGEGGRVRRRRRGMHRAAARLEPMPPLRVTADEVWLMTIEDGRAGWCRRARFPLAPAGGEDRR